MIDDNSLTALVGKSARGFAERHRACFESLEVGTLPDIPAALLVEIGSITEGSNGRFTVKLGEETEVFDRPRGKDLDTQQVVDLRRMLRAAGFTPESIHE